ncbi:MAG: hypothetical protein HUU47_06245 [Bacteroidetes bacterium]|nr:hypothetical protein [Bacteroidota bacterium]
MNRRLIILKFMIFVFAYSYSQTIDIKILDAINNKPQKNDNFWKAITYTATPVSIATPVSMFLISYKTNDKFLQSKSFETATSLAANALITYSLKYGINRQRPFVNNKFIFKKQKQVPLHFHQDILLLHLQRL